MRKNLLFLILALSAIALASAPGAFVAAQARGPAAAADSLIQELMKKQEVPGLTVAVIQRGAVAFTHSYGMSDVENAVSASTATEFRMASLVKPITAVAAMKLVAEGKLDLDAPVQQYCPTYPQQKSPDGKTWTVTTRELLSHRAGIGWYEGNEQRNSAHYDHISDSIRIFGPRPLAFEPGSSMKYSSYGYVVVGCAIEGASGVPYLDYVQRTIFQPAGMKATVVDDPRRIIAHRAHGYERAEGNHESEIENSPFFDPSDRIPAGGFLSTAEDIARFASALMQGKLLDRQKLETMWQPAAAPNTRDPATSQYGLGWGIYSLHGKRVVGHNGGQVGTSTALRIMPEQQVAVAVMCNLEGVSLDDLAMQILQLFVAEAPPPN